MKTIFAIGGSTIKTAYSEIKLIAQEGKIDVLMHNGASIFHDFQRATEHLSSHSHSLDKLLVDYEPDRAASELVWKWVHHWQAPEGSLTDIVQQQGKDVFMFTILGGDFWHLFGIGDWRRIAQQCEWDFYKLCRLMKEPFHFINLGSAVVHPEVFTKALAVAHPKEFRADVVDFKSMYRPLTRVAKYGTFYHMTIKDYLVNYRKWYKGGN